MAAIMQKHEQGHPTPAKYVAIAVILSVITLVEVGVVYVVAGGGFLIALLMALSAVKFALVAMFFMHLRFDHKLFSALFVGGLLLASAVLIALMTLFGVFFA